MSSMINAVKDFAKQFDWQPKIENAEKFEKLGKFEKFVVAGMGGSHLAGDVIKTVRPELDIIVHPNYGLPDRSDIADGKTLIIASSYSGTTEEAVDAFDHAHKQGFPLVSIALGKTMIERAKSAKAPYVVIPDTGISPRSALGYSLLGILELMRMADLQKLCAQAGRSIDTPSLEEEGKRIADLLKGRVPVIYASQRNFSLAYNWKIKFNETGKVPAFYNIFPELNHNEINGFDVKDGSKKLTDSSHFIFITDENDHPKIKTRMRVTEKLYRDRGLNVEVLELSGKNYFERIFKSLITADWTAIHSALNYGLIPDGQPIVDEFKTLI